jgi:hypothetical protein
MLDNFAVFILTHGRPDNVITYKTLQRQGYTGPVYIIVDNEDKTIDQYRKNFGDKVIVFDKLGISKTFDTGDNFSDRRAVVYARNACFGIAKELGIEYFLQLDDDYYEFQYKINSSFEYPSDFFTVKSKLGNVFSAMLAYYKTIPAKSIAMLQGGDFFGGADGFGKPKRKCMNTFFCSAERPFQFIGRINEDVNTYTWFQGLGNLFLSVPFLMMNQTDTQESRGGMSEMYLDSGTYIKSFYTVIYAPSCVHVGMMGDTHKRLHHRINWKSAVPCIVEEKYRKRSQTPELLTD